MLQYHDVRVHVNRVSPSSSVYRANCYSHLKMNRLSRTEKGHLAIVNGQKLSPMDQRCIWG